MLLRICAGCIHIKELRYTERGLFCPKAKHLFPYIEFAIGPFFAGDNLCEHRAGSERRFKRELSIKIHNKPYLLKRGMFYHNGEPALMACNPNDNLAYYILNYSIPNSGLKMNEIIINTEDLDMERMESVLMDKGIIIPTGRTCEKMGKPIYKLLI